MNDITEPAERPLQAWRDEVYALERRGMLYFAYDAAMRALEAPVCAGDLWLRHRAVLALARAGATEAAQSAFDALALDAQSSDSEVATLAARIAKDMAMRASGDERLRLLSAAAERYEAVHRRSADAYPAINAATLRRLAGEDAQAVRLAQEALALAGATQPEGALAIYFNEATLAEAHLVLGDEASAASAIERAAAVDVADLVARASTRKQLRLLVDHMGLPDSLLAPLESPRVIHYAGHMISGDGRFRHEEEPVVRAEIERLLDEVKPAIAYGSLASGADLLFVEALLARGADVTAVLPFSREDFVRVSVAPAGDEWVTRFEAAYSALDAQDRVLYVTEDDYLGDDNLFLYADEFAMGLALLRADHIDAEAQQLTVWDGKRTDATAGTYKARETWATTGHPQRHVSVSHTISTEAQARETATPKGPERRRCALLFGDFKGFSKLPDRLLPAYVEQVLGTVESVVARFPVAVSNTWGDAVYLVLEDVADAASCALDMQAAVAAIDWTGLGFAAPLQLRLGGHYGPVYRTRDPILKAITYVGAHVSRAARVEPVTPPGGVYVTEQFATKLALSHVDQFKCEYVGLRDLPKNYGQLPLHLVRARQ